VLGVVADGHHLRAFQAERDLESISVPGDQAGLLDVVENFLMAIVVLGPRKDLVEGRARHQSASEPVMDPSLRHLHPASVGLGRFSGQNAEVALAHDVATLVREKSIGGFDVGADPRLRELDVAIPCANRFRTESGGLRAPRQRGKGDEDSRKPSHLNS
jgi:hypothetical protein